MRRALFASAVVPAAVLSGCVSDDPGRHVPSVGPEPLNAAPAQLVVNVKDFVDSDGNGYLDSGTATVYVLCGYALPLSTAGSFDFRLLDPSGGVVAHWAITPEQAEGCRIKTQVGPGYGFTLDLRRLGAEKTEAHEALLEGVFTDSRGRTARSGRLTVTIGRTR